MKRSNYLLLLMCLVTVVPVASAQFSTARDIRSVMLGLGYSSLDDTPTTLCVNNVSAVPVNVAEGNFVIDKTASYEEIAETLGLSLSGRAQYALGSATASAKFLRESQSSNYSQSLSYVYDLKLPTMMLYPSGNIEDVLTPGAVSTLGRRFRRGNEIPIEFYNLCGDKYISEIHYGAKLFISAKITFNSQAMRNSFGASVGARGSWGAFMTEIARSRTTLNNNATISVSAYQLGGDPSFLGRIFQRRSRNAEDYGHVAILRCSIADLDHCTKALEDLVLYASGQEPGDFGTQLRRNSDGSVASGGAVIGYALSQYRPLLGSDSLSYMIDANLLEMRRSLGLLFTRLNALEDDNETIMSSSISAQAVASASTNITMLRRFRALIVSQSPICFEGGTRSQIFDNCSLLVDCMEKKFNKTFLGQSEISLNGCGRFFPETRR